MATPCRDGGRGAARAEDAQGTPTQSHISPSILVYEDKKSLTHFKMFPLRSGAVPCGDGVEDGDVEGDERDHILGAIMCI